MLLYIILILADNNINFHIKIYAVWKERYILWSHLTDEIQGSVLNGVFLAKSRPSWRAQTAVAAILDVYQ